MNKGIVMEITDKYLVVMTPQGSFDRVPRTNRVCEVGEEILYSEPALRLKKSTITMVSSLVAAVFFSLVVFASWYSPSGSKQVVAYVSMDINPSVEMGIDANKKVRDLRGLNDDGRSLVKDVKYEGKSVDDVTEDLLQKAEPNYLSKGEADIVITGTLVNDEQKLSDFQLVEQVKQDVTLHIMKEHAQRTEAYRVSTVVATWDAREEAKSAGISVGKYMIYLAAKNAGQSITVDDMKKQSIHDLAKTYGGIGKLLNDGSVTKEEVKQLVDDEKSGALDKKVETNDKNKKPDDQNKKSTPKPSTKGTITPTPSSAAKKPVLSPTPSPKETSKGNGKDDKDAGKSDDKKKNSPAPATTPPAKQEDKVEDKKDEGKKDNGSNSNTPKPKDDKKEDKEGDSAANPPSANSNKGEQQGKKEDKDKKNN